MLQGGQRLLSPEKVARLEVLADLAQQRRILVVCIVVRLAEGSIGPLRTDEVAGLQRLHKLRELLAEDFRSGGRIIIGDQCHNG